MSGRGCTREPAPGGEGDIRSNIRSFKVSAAPNLLADWHWHARSVAFRGHRTLQFPAIVWNDSVTGRVTKARRGSVWPKDRIHSNCEWPVTAASRTQSLGKYSAAPDRAETCQLHRRTQKGINLTLRTLFQNKKARKFMSIFLLLPFFSAKKICMRFMPWNML